MGAGKSLQPPLLPDYSRESSSLQQLGVTPRSRLILYPYYVLLWGTFGCSVYGMCRMVMGHKTWFSKG
ncbi:hypothetical protein NA57DRAFT_70404 [Rhizodiscina lignyota]|uniref:Uncharacterized protein n=1 Tax=Rhizodiscina lignyota TaxID=1504668 RepID=A0A9P4ME74_9PEZI|nr:hypothetical protein NA57DRAFT_70404 [Rhizodiscina lignyota]